MTVSPFLANKQRNPLLSNYSLKIKAQSFATAHPLANSQPLFGGSVNHNSNGDQFIFSGGKAKSAAVTPASSKLLFKGRMGEDDQGIFYEENGRKYAGGYDTETDEPYYYKDAKTNKRTPLVSSAPPPAEAPPPQKARVVYRDEEGDWLPYGDSDRRVRYDQEGPYFYKDDYDADRDKRTSVRASQDPYNVTGYFGKNNESSSMALVATSSQPTKAARTSSAKKNSNLRDLPQHTLAAAIEDENTFYYHGKRKGQPQLWFRWPGGGSFKVKSDKVQLWVETRRNELWNIKPVYDKNPPPPTINVAGAESSTDGDSGIEDKVKEYVGGHAKKAREGVVSTAIGTGVGQQVGRVTQTFIPTNTTTHKSYRKLNYTPATALPPPPAPDDWDEAQHGPFVYPPRPADWDSEEDGEYVPPTQWDVPPNVRVTLARGAIDELTGEEIPAVTRPLVRAGNPPRVFTDWTSYSEDEHDLPSAHGEFSKPINKVVRSHIVNRDGTTQDGDYTEEIGTKRISRHTDYKHGVRKVEKGVDDLIGGVGDLLGDVFGGSKKKRHSRRDEELAD